MPAFANVSSYDLTIGVKVNMDEAIYLLSPVDDPLLGGTMSDGLSVLSSAPVDEVQFDWMHDTILTPRTTLAAQIATTSHTEIVVASGDQAKFSTGDLIKIIKAGVDEMVRVTGYSATTADTLLVTKGYSGTAATYVTSAVVIGVGTGLAEGSDPENPRVVDRTQASNLTQIFGPTKLRMTETEMLVSKYGVPNEFAHQLQRIQKEQVIAVNQAYIYGVKTNSTTTKIRSTGGIDYWMSQSGGNTDSTNTQLTELVIQANMQTVYDNGGLPNRLIVNPAVLKDLNDIANTGRVRQEMMDTRRGRSPVTTIITEFGDLPVCRNRWVHKTHAFAINREAVVRRVLRPMTFEWLAKTGDSRSGQVVREEGLEVKGIQHQFRLTALASY